MLLDVRFGYGADTPLDRDDARRDAGSVAGPDALVLRGPLALTQTGPRVAAHCTVKQGRAHSAAAHLVPVARAAARRRSTSEQALASTESYWREWAGRCTYQGRWRDAVVRSLLTLKALTYAPTGGIVAAPTTSLPEEIGGVRNWDYRFCWLRDASLTLDALHDRRLRRRGRAPSATGCCARSRAHPADLQIMYGIDGERRLTEFELPWLPGYEGSKPVRVGNAASGQFQLDVYGEVMSCLYAGAQAGAAGARTEGWRCGQGAASTFIETAWQRPDDGIWEVRGGRRHFTHSKVMAWVAVDRVARVDRGVRPRRRRGRDDAAPPRARCASGSTPRCASAASTRAWARSRSRTAATSWTRACW